MAWISKRQNMIRVALLALLLVSFFGPWAYSSDGVPPPEWCAAPNILLESGRCVGLVTGIYIIVFMVGAFFSLLAGLISGALFSAEWGAVSLGEFLFTLFPFMLVLPFLSTLLQIRAGEHAGSRIFNTASWALAALAAFPFILSSQELPVGRMWGIWLYSMIAICAFLWELLSLLAGARRRGISDDPRLA